MLGIVVMLVRGKKGGGSIQHSMPCFVCCGHLFIYCIGVRTGGGGTKRNSYLAKINHIQTFKFFKIATLTPFTCNIKNSFFSVKNRIIYHPWITGIFLNIMGPLRSEAFHSAFCIVMIFFFWKVYTSTNWYNWWCNIFPKARWRFVFATFLRFCFSLFI